MQRRAFRAASCLILPIVASLIHAQTSAPLPEFEVASIKPNANTRLTMVGYAAAVGGRLNGTAVTLRDSIEFAYKLRPWEIAGATDWMATERFNVVAKAPEGTAPSLLQPMLQTLLADRFKLVVHRETKEMTVYVLVPARGGLKLQPSRDDGCVTRDKNSPPLPPATPGQPRPPACGSFYTGATVFAGGRITTGQLATGLSSILGRPVSDQTGYTGTFDARLEFSREGTAFGGGPAGLTAQSANIDASAPSIFTVVQDQLGIRIDSQKGRAEVLVIDHAERPTEN